MVNISLVLDRIYNKLSINKDSDFAEKFNLSPSTISKWKSRNTISFEFISEVCYHNSISLDYAFWGIEKEEESYDEEIVFNSIKFRILHEKEEKSNGFQHELILLYRILFNDNNIDKWSNLLDITNLILSYNFNIKNIDHFISPSQLEKTKKNLNLFLSTFSEYEINFLINNKLIIKNYIYKSRNIVNQYITFDKNS